MHLNQTLMWIIFHVLVVGMLALDLGVFNRRAHVIGFKEAVIWTVVWIMLAFVFNFFVYLWHGSRVALEFLTAYIIEKSLSVDNIFVFIMIFSYFGIDPKYQHRVLFWGIIGAVIMRALFILTGVTLMKLFHPVIYLFGAFLVYTGIRMGFKKDEKVEPEKNPVLKIFRKYFPVASDFKNGRFFTKLGGKIFATPLFVTLLVIETTDVIFALDSIPAVLAITPDAFIAYTSNIFAVLGLRALYFVISGFIVLFRYFKYGLSAVLVFIGVKMLISDLYKIPIEVALGVVFGILFISVVVSLVARGSEESA